MCLLNFERLKSGNTFRVEDASCLRLAALCKGKAVYVGKGSLLKWEGRSLGFNPKKSKLLFTLITIWLVSNIPPALSPSTHVRQ